MTTRKLPTLLATLFLITPMHALGVTIDQLTITPRVTDIQISPSGRYLAVRAAVGGKYVLEFFDRKTLKPVGMFAMPYSADVGTYHWANDERVVGTVLDVPPFSVQPVYYGELFATNFDGTKKELLCGVRSDREEREWADIVNMLPKDHKHILISTSHWSSAHASAGQVKLLNIYTGSEKAELIESRYGHGSFYSDSDGTVRLITSLTPHNETVVEMYPNRKTGWVDLPQTSHGEAFTPVAFSTDDTSAYVLDNFKNDRIGLYQLALDGSSYKQIYTHNRVDITGAITTADDKSVYALRIDNGYPSYLIFSQASPEAKLFKNLLQTFRGQQVSIMSRTLDGRYWIVRTGSDVDSGTYRLFDRDKNQIETLFKERPGVNASELSPMKPIEFKSFDGTTVDGYFTAAKSPTHGIAPMVVLVHGGPADRDYWGYNSEVQALAIHGFSVLQVNYRGSAGYGKAFQEASRRQWGNAVQRDIIAGTRWAILNKMAISGHICIMGVSFGAYSAVQSAILAPDLYRCAVAASGIYDLSLLSSSRYYGRMYNSKDYFAKQIGTDKNELRRYSPVDNVQRLQVPLFIVHGEKDFVAPFKHAKELKAALDKYGKTYQWMVKRHEGHGFYDNQDEVDYLKAAIKFMRGYIAG